MIFDEKKFLKAYDLVLLFLKKSCFFVLGMAHGDPIFAQVGPKMVIFRGFSKKNFRTTGFQLKLLILIESPTRCAPNIFHRKPVKKKSKWVWSWGKI